MAEEQAKEIIEDKEEKDTKAAKETKEDKEPKDAKKAQKDEPTKKWNSDIKKLGDKIVGLTLMQAKELGDYLKEEYGIEPAAGAAVRYDGGTCCAGPGRGKRGENKF